MCAIREQRRLNEQHATTATASVRSGSRTENDKPFHLPWLPQVELCRVIPVLIEARVAHTRKMAVVGLPLY